MSAWRAALDLLSRPAAPVAPPEPPKGKKAGAAPSWAQAEAEASAAYVGLAEERVAAMHSIETFGQRRDALLLEDGTDEALVKLGVEIDRANKVLERLDVLQPKMAARLGDIRVQAREVRWIELRDRMAVRFEALANAEAEYERRRQEWLAVATETVQLYWSDVYTTHQDAAPDPRDIIPHLAPLRPYTETFADQLAAFRTATLVPKQHKPAGSFVSLAAHVEFAKFTGEIRYDCPLAWRGDVERALKKSLTIELTAAYTDKEGHTHNKGAVLEMPTDDAMERVRLGRAVFK